MQAHKVTLTIIDMDQLGADEIKSVIENTRYPNRCISPDVVGVETVEIGEWSDDHPLNNTLAAPAEWLRLFPPVFSQLVKTTRRLLDNLYEFGAPTDSIIVEQVEDALNSLVKG